MERVFDVLFVVRVVDDPEHPPLVVGVVVNGEGAVRLNAALGELAREARAPAGPHLQPEPRRE